MYVRSWVRVPSVNSEFFSEFFLSTHLSIIIDFFAPINEKEQTNNDSKFRERIFNLVL